MALRVRLDGNDAVIDMCEQILRRRSHAAPWTGDKRLAHAVQVRGLLLGNGHRLPAPRHLTHSVVYAPLGTVMVMFVGGCCASLISTAACHPISAHASSQSMRWCSPRQDGERGWVIVAFSSRQSISQPPAPN
jgi:hypothetical protein